MSRQNIYKKIVMLGLITALYLPSMAWTENPPNTQNSIQGFFDHKAMVFQLSGPATILKKNGLNWNPVQVNTVIEAGDQIVSTPQGGLNIVFDPYYLNILRIQPNTKVTFESIEPTQITLEDGTIYNLLDGLRGTSYKVVTPTAILGVRGTYFDARVLNGRLQHVAVFKDRKKKMGRVDVAYQGASYEVTEGNQFRILDNMQAVIEQVIDPEFVSALGEFTSQVQNLVSVFKDQGDQAIESENYEQMAEETYGDEYQDDPSWESEDEGTEESYEEDSADDSSEEPTDDVDDSDQEDSSLNNDTEEEADN